jgi:hypothetical protein
VNNQQFIDFVKSVKEIVPFEVTNAVAHLVFEDYNFRDSDIEFQLKWIDDKGYESILSDYYFDVDSAHYVAFIRGILQMMLSVPEEIRVFNEDDE